MQKADTNITDAVTHPVDGSTKTQGECEGAVYACFWWGALQGDATRFANAHQNDTLTMWNLDKAIGKHASLRNDVVTGTYPGSVTVHNDRIVVGDYLYMVNYLYAPVVEYPFFKQKKWIQTGTTYFWNGENCICVGHNDQGDPLYAGSGISGTKTEAEMRETLRTHYNTDLATVIANQGVLKKPVKLLNLTFNQDATITKIHQGTEADSAIAFYSCNSPCISK